MQVEETNYHFIGECPILKEIRYVHFRKIILSISEVIVILNEYIHYNTLVNYIIEALQYRNELIHEFNY